MLMTLLPALVDDLASITFTLNTEGELYTFYVHNYMLMCFTIDILVFADLRLTVDYKFTNKKTSKQLSDRHVEIGNAVLKVDTVLHEQSFGCEGHCLASAFENLREGILHVQYHCCLQCPILRMPIYFQDHTKYA